jgi:ArsR family transcriptional regulator
MNQTELIDWCKALGEENRLAIVLLLRAHGPCAGHEILDALPDLTQPGLSRHLSILREAGLVQGTKRGREIHYRIVMSSLLREALANLEVQRVPKNINQTEYEVLGETVVEPAPGEDFQDWLR